MTTIPIPEIGEITLTIQDSFNCCDLGCLCFRSRADKKKVYVNAKGGVEKFSKEKAGERKLDSFQRSTFHLLAAIYKKVDAYRGEIDRIVKQINPMIVEAEKQQAISLAQIEKINSILIAHALEKLDSAIKRLDK